MSLDLVVLGDSNMDIVGKVDRLPLAGECAYGDSVHLRVGGSGINTALGARRLGLSVCFVSQVGNDEFGTKILQLLMKEGIDSSFVNVSEDFPTGVVFSVVTNDEERTFFSYRRRAADIHIKYENLPESLPDSPLIYLTGVSVVESEETFETFYKFLIGSKKKGSKVFFDPNLRDFRLNTSERLLSILKITDVFLPNKAELDMIFNHCGDSINSVEKLQSLGISEIWIKNGQRGCELIKGKEKLDFPGILVNSVDTTGAGDAFNAGILRGYSNNMDFAKIGTFANQYAAKSTERLGAAESYPYLHEFSE